jgi:carboxylesterase type B
MEEECSSIAKANCGGDKTCLGCIVDKALCFVNPVSIAEGVAKCIPPLILLNPLGCPEQWVDHYALHCVEGFFKCYPQRPQPVVDTEFGKVAGLTRAYKEPSEKRTRPVDMFWGIPFAAPPTGTNRFKPPQPFNKPWAPATRDASHILWAHICTQIDLAGNLHLGQEDCLYLNVARPTGANSNSNLPVFIWIYGGGYFIGDGYEFGVYDAGHIVGTHEYVVVSMNYRLSGLGFMALPELMDESQTTGNYGVQDQRAAMQWVQRNIKNFGGDPSQVTIAGESAGAFSTMWHLTSPGSKGLFHGAIMESGTSSVNWFFQNKTEAFEFYDDFAAILGCNLTKGEKRLACLRKLPHHTFVLSFGQMIKDIAAKMLHLPIPKDIPDFAPPLWPLMPFGPVIDGTQAGLPDVPLKLVQRGEFNKVPLILGSNKDGGAYFGPIVQLLWGNVQPNIRELAEWFLPEKEDQRKMLSLYGGTDFPNDMRRTGRVMRDIVFMCADRALAGAWSKAGLPTHLYTFAFDFGPNIVERALGDAHAFELPFVWKNYDKVLGYLAKDEKNYSQMSDIMSCTWASFVKCQAPKCPSPPPNCDDTLGGVVDWPQFSNSARKIMSFKLPTTVESIKSTGVYPTDDFPGDDRCDFWDTAHLDWRDVRQRITQKWFLPPTETTIVV